MGVPSAKKLIVTTLVVVNNRYRILSCLGRGAGGAVHLVEDLAQGNRRLALKTIHPEGLHADRMDFFRREFSCLARMHHPNLEEVYDFGESAAEHSLFFTSEFIAGVNLRDAVAFLSTEASLEILVQLCRALQFIHSQNLIHHDVKPSNVLLAIADPDKVRSLLETGEPVAESRPFGTSREELAGTGLSVQRGRGKMGREAGGRQKGGTEPQDVGTVKLIDFGLARDQTTSLGQVVRGTVAYMAPEVIAGTEATTRVDLYSLGVLAYQMFTKRLPFEAPTPSEVLRAHLKTEPMPLRLLCPGLPPAIERIVLRLLEKSPSDRFQTANEVLEALREATGRPYEIDTTATQRAYLETGKFVGRQGELERMIDFAEQSLRRKRTETEPPEVSSARRHPGIVLVSAPAGMGKTRFLEEFRIYCQLERIHFLRAACGPWQGTGYQPVVDLVQEAVRVIAAAELARLEEIRQLSHRTGSRPFRMGPSELRETRRSMALASLVDRYREGLSQLLLERNGPDPSTEFRGRARLSPQELLSEITDFLLEASRFRPLALCLEDLQWASEGTVRFLDQLTEKLAGALGSVSRKAPPSDQQAGFARIDRVGEEQTAVRSAASEVATRSPQLLVLLSARLEEISQSPAAALVESLRAQGHLRPLPLGPLTESEVQRLVESFFGGRSSNPALLQGLSAKSGGNPFVLVEVLKNLLDARKIRLDKDRWSASEEDLEKLLESPSADRLLEQRLTILSPDEREILATVAAWGERISYEHLHAASPAAHGKSLADLLRHLEEHGLVRCQWHRGSYEYLLATPRLRSVVFQNVPENDRRAIHQRLLDAWESWQSQLAGRSAERQSRDCPRASSALLAQQAIQARDARRAARYGLRATEELFGLGSWQEAGQLLEELLALGLEADPDETETFCELLLRHAQAVWQLGQWSQAEQNLLRAAELAKAADRVLARARAHEELARLYARKEEPDRAAAELEAAWRSLKESGLGADRVAPLLSLASLSSQFGQQKLALEIAETAAREAARADDRRAAAEAQRIAAEIAHRSGQFPQAILHAQSAAEISRKAEDSLGAARARAVEGISALELEEWQRAEECLTEAFHGLGDGPAPEPAIEWVVGMAALDKHRGQLASAHERLENASRLAVKAEPSESQARYFLELGRVCFLRGGFPKAAQSLHKALELGQAIPSPRGSLEARIASGKLFLEAGQYRDSVKILEHALRQAAAQKDEDALSRALGAKARLLWRLGRVAETIGCLAGSREASCAAHTWRQRGENLLARSEMRDVVPPAERRGAAEEALGLYKAHGDILGEADAQSALGEILAEENRIEEAVTLLGRSREIFDWAGCRGALGWALYRLASCEAGRNELKLAAAILREALSLGLQTGLPELVWRVEGALASVAERRRKIRFAGQYLRRAIASVRRLSESVPEEYRESFLADSAKQQLLEDARRLIEKYR